MEQVQRDRDIIEVAVEAFKRATGLHAEPLYDDQLGMFNANAVIAIGEGARAKRYTVEVKQALTNNALGPLIAYLHGTRTLLVTPYVNQHQARRLKEAGVLFMDATGNAFFADQYHYIYVTGLPRDKEKLAPHRDERQAALGTAAMKVIFTLLCAPEYLNATYRDVAKAAGVALGAIPGAMQKLYRAGHVLDLGRGRRRFRDKKKLVGEWVALYPQQVVPKLKVRRFTAVEANWWKGADLADFNACWGGEAAAAFLTDYLRPEIITIYVQPPIAPIIAKNRLRADPHGKVVVVEKFWNFDLHTDLAHLAPPLLVYADLVATGDPRNLEAARLIYEQRITRLIGED